MRRSQSLAPGSKPATRSARTWRNGRSRGGRAPECESKSRRSCSRSSTPRRRASSVQRPKLVRIDHRGQVEQRPGGRRHRYCRRRGPLGRLQAMAMDDDAVVVALPRGDDVNGAGQGRRAGGRRRDPTSGRRSRATPPRPGRPRARPPARWSPRWVARRPAGTRPGRTRVTRPVDSGPVAAARARGRGHPAGRR